MAPILGPDSIGDRKRHEEIDGVAGRQIREAGFSNADNHAGNVVQAHRAADDRALPAKSALPVSVTQHNGRRRGRGIIRHAKRAAYDRIDAQSGKEIAGDILALGHARRPVTAQIIVERAREGGHARKSVGLGTEGFEKRYGERAITREIQAVAVAAVTLKFWALMRAPTEDHKLLRVFYRQRTQNYCVDETENCGVGADAESESDNDNGREAGRTGESAYRVADILQ